MDISMLDGSTLANGAVPVMVYFITNYLKSILKGKEWFDRLLPIVPIVLCFALSFIPGIGPVAATIGGKLIYAFTVGAMTGQGHEILKRNIKGIAKDGSGAKTGNEVIEK